ncbi:MAG: hypothetical protein KGI26_07395 [Thaumarchaeota archaeon]|nr:hypothetical protein [Nitrososphaerota archaeon]
MREGERPNRHPFYVRLAVVAVLVGLALASRQPSAPNHRLNFLWAQERGTSAKDPGVERRQKGSSKDPGNNRIESLNLENAQLRKELRKLKAENEQLKSWPDHGESVLADNDA